ncbi:hypothetical protein ALC60_05518 [Trachymyrmex zeteki]|uniref:Uncharacterized protein n=1 Tax=Mycetomoellerius zeteki TaxID=64791 RepID=A0A151X5C3_9HYME|nr:hypothetical protein ALC60_05518 [Trachymyrmex zeteki]
MPRQLEEVDGPLCPAPGSVLFFRASSTSQSDTPPHSTHFSPPLCQCTTDVDEQRAEVVCVVSSMTHERERVLSLIHKKLSDTDYEWMTHSVPLILQLT